MQHREEYIYNAHTGWKLINEQSFTRTTKTGHINSPEEKFKTKLNYSPNFHDSQIPIQKEGGPRIKKDYTPLSKEKPEDAIYGAYESLKNFRKTIEDKPLQRDLPAIIRVTALINTFIRENYNNQFKSKIPNNISQALANLYNSYKELSIILSEKGDNGKSASLFRNISSAMNLHLKSTALSRNSIK